MSAKRIFIQMIQKDITKYRQITAYKQSVAITERLAYVALELMTEELQATGSDHVITEDGEGVFHVAHEDKHYTLNRTPAHLLDEDLTETDEASPYFGLTDAEGKGTDKDTCLKMYDVVMPFYKQHLNALGDNDEE